MNSCHLLQLSPSAPFQLAVAQVSHTHTNTPFFLLPLPGPTSSFPSSLHLSFHPFIPPSSLPPSLIFWELIFWEVDILRVDISGIDILGFDILRLTPFLPPSLPQFISLVQLHPIIAVSGPSCSGKTGCIQCGVEVLRGLCGVVSCVTLAIEAMKEEQLMGYQLDREKYVHIIVKTEHLEKHLFLLV